MGSDSSLERLVGLVLEDSEDGELRRRDILVVERGEIETLVLLEGLVSDDLRKGSQTKGEKVSFGERSREKREEGEENEPWR